MSWSVAAIGKAAAVAAKIEQDFAGMGKCAEPEETVKQSARATLAASLAAQDPTAVVKVSASGSQSTDYTTKSVRNQMSISIEPQ
jgi:hypothetical protein